MATHSSFQQISLNHRDYFVIDAAFRKEWQKTTIHLLSTLFYTAQAMESGTNNVRCGDVVKTILGMRAFQSAIGQYTGITAVIPQTPQSAYVWKTILSATPRDAEQVDLRNFLLHHLPCLMQQTNVNVNYLRGARAGDIQGIERPVLLDGSAAAVLRHALLNQWTSATSALVKLISDVSINATQWDTSYGWRILHDQLVDIVDLQRAVACFDGTKLVVTTTTSQLLSWFSTISAISQKECSHSALRCNIVRSFITVMYRGGALPE